jgi:inosose dehydratase
LSEGAAIGYAGFELGNKFPKESTALRAVLAPYGLACVSGWYSGRLADPARSVEEEIEAVGPHLRLLAESGAGVMVYGEVADAIQGLPQALRRRPRWQDDSQWQAYGAKLDAFAAHTLRHGVRLAYHHHMGAYVEAPEDIDRLMAATGPDVGLLFDTGHMLFGGGDVLAMLDKHIARVCHVHCKDVRPAVAKMARNRDWSFLQSVLNGAFTVPGDGCIDFAAVLGRLARHGYRGWLVVEAEQDPAVAPSFKYAQMGYRHIRPLVDAINAEGV